MAPGRNEERRRMTFAFLILDDRCLDDRCFYRFLMEPLPEEWLFTWAGLPV